MKMGVGETFRCYANRYWELYNEIGGGNEKVAASTFRLGLLQDSKLQDLLNIRPLESMHKLMKRIEESKRLEDDRRERKGKAPATSQYAKDLQTRGFQPRLRRELRIQEPNVRLGEINVAFNELVHKILERIKNEPYFRWSSKMGGDLSKMGGDPTRRNQSFYCTYH